MQFLHIHCGDSSAETLRQSGVPGEILVWREIYTEGPVPGDLPEGDWRRVRAEFLASMGLSVEGALAGIDDRYERLGRAGQYDEVVLWFDACMFDQTIMVHLIERLRSLAANTRVSLICVSDRGLGEYPPAEMAGLLDGRRELGAGDFELAGDAWRAFTSDRPTDIEELIDGDCTALPFVAPALRRHLEQYPSVANGLNRLEAQSLAAVASGADLLGPIFSAVSGMEEQAFFGDSTLWACLDGLASVDYPALTINGPGRIVKPIHEPLNDIGRWSASVTDTGRCLIAGSEDWVRLNGIDRWLGGVHLRGVESPWRWDGSRGCLVSGAQ